MEFLRLFIAIKLPEDFTKKLIDYQAKLNAGILRITLPQNLHLTLLFLGEIPRDKIPDLQNIIAQNIISFKPAPINFKQITYGPNPQLPRLLWLIGYAPSQYNNLKKNISKNIQQELNLNLNNDTYDFLPHITLARIKTNSFHSLPPIPTPDIFNNYSFTPNKIWLEQSILKKEGPQYIDLADFNINNYE